MLARRGTAVVADHARFAAMQRPAMYAITNCLLAVQAELQRRFALRPAEMQILMLVATASVQRFVRMSDPPAEYLAGAPLPAELHGGVSRRRIADATGLPRESVRRHIARLIDRGLVVERASGGVGTPRGVAVRAEAFHAPDDVLAPVVAMVDALFRVGALRLAG